MNDAKLITIGVTLVALLRNAGAVWIIWFVLKTPHVDNLWAFMSLLLICAPSFKKGKIDE